MVKTITTRDRAVGEANNPPKVAEAPKKAPVKIVAKPKEDPLSAVRIVRGTDATSYEVQPDKRPALALTPPARLAAPAAPAAAEEQKATPPAGPSFVRHLARGLGTDSQTTSDQKSGE